MAYVTPPRGMRDFLPAEKARRERVLSVIRNSYLAHGFEEIETPVMEDAQRLHSGLGGDNEKLAFAVMKRGLTGEDLRAAATSEDPLALADLGLRFDLTVPLARFYASHRAALPPVFRSVQIAPVWRAERPQKGRFRQFVQCDIDIIGEPGPLAESELLAATSDTLEALGLSGCRIRINDRRILTALLNSWGVDPEAHGRVLISLDKLDKLGVDGVADELAELSGSIDAPTLADRSLVTSTLADLATADWSLLERGPAPIWLDHVAFTELLSLRENVPTVAIDFDPTLVRGMGYYTGTIFEIAHPDVPYSLGGGGRYDGMIGRFLGTDVPACGFSIGFERIVELVTELHDDAVPLTAVLYEADVDTASLMTIKRELTGKGVRVRLENRAKNQRAQLERLATEGCDRFALVTSENVKDSGSWEFRSLR